MLFEQQPIAIIIKCQLSPFFDVLTCEKSNVKTSIAKFDAREHILTPIITVIDET